MQVQRSGSPEWADLDEEAEYRYAGYWFPAAHTVGGITTSGRVRLLRAPDGAPRDATDVVGEYLTRHVVHGEEARIRLVGPLPPRIGQNPEIQPLAGAR